MKKNIPMFLAGLFCGAALFGGSVAYAAGILATPPPTPTSESHWTVRKSS